MIVYFRFSETDFQKLITLYFLSREVQTHLDFYDHGDIQVFPLGHKSRDLWLLPPDEIQRFIDELKEEESIDMDITITVYRSTQESEYPVPEELGHTVVLNKTILLELADILETENYGKFIRIPDSLTKFLKVIFFDDDDYRFSVSFIISLNYRLDWNKVCHL